MNYLINWSFNSRTREGATFKGALRPREGSFNSRTREGATARLEFLVK